MLATAMVFGSTVSASSWEAFRQAIEALTKVFANRPDLVVKHKICVCAFLASGYGWGTVMHEIPISSSPILMTSLLYPRTQ